MTTPQSGTNTTVDPRTLGYEKMDPIDHIRARPQIYIGTMIPEDWTGWILDLATPAGQPLRMKQHRRMLCRPAKHVFLELLGNAADNADDSWRAGINPGRIEVWADQHKIMIRNFGKNIPVGKHKDGLWLPEFIFGSLHTSGNFKRRRFVIGQNGYGAKLANIFSAWFEVFIVDAQAGLQYRQVWTNGMKNVSQPEITKTDNKISETRITYVLDFNYFSQYGMGAAGYDMDWLGMLARYVADISLACKIPCTFNNLTLNFMRIEDYSTLLFPAEKIKTSIVYRKDDLITDETSGKVTGKGYAPMIELMVLDTPNSGTVLSFVNGIMTAKGGVHVDAALKAVSQHILDSINPKTESKSGENLVKLTLADVRPHVSILMCCRLQDPEFDQQTKQKLLKPVPVIDITAKELKQVNEWDLSGHLMAAYEAKNWRKQDKNKGKRMAKLKAKAEDAANAGKANCDTIAYVVEGDSGVTNVLESLSHLSKAERANIGIFPFKGKILNVLNADLYQLMANEELNGFKAFMGFTEGGTDGWKTLRYKRIIMKFDADDDGKHITALFILWLHCRFPRFLKEGRLFLERTPILRVDVGSKSVSFFSRSSYARWLHENPGMEGYKPVYYKGLGTSSDDDIKQDVSNRRMVTMVYDEKASDKLKTCFDEKLADMRKQLISIWKERYEIEAIQALPISFFLDEEFIQYWKRSIERAIPHVMDNFKSSQRKIMQTVFDEWGVMDKKFASAKKMAQMKVETLANLVALKTHYEHGAKSLEDAIFLMAADFVGSNNMPYLQRNGQFGSRRKGGKDKPAARYPNTCPEPWLHYMYFKIDQELVPNRVVDGETVEKQFFLPVIPMQLVNGANGIGSGWSVFFPNFHPREVMQWYRIKNLMCLADEKTGSSLKLITPRPWWRGFLGEIELKKIAVHTKITERPEFGGEISSEDMPTFTAAEYKMIEPIKEAPCKHRLSIVTKGIVNLVRDKYVVTELPVGRWTKNYEMFLESLVEQKKAKRIHSDPSKKKIYFEIEGLQVPGTLEELKLTKSYSMSNMVMLMPDSSVYKFSTAEEFLEYFFKQRYFYYEERRKLIVRKQEEKIKELKQRILFQQLVKERKLILEDREISDIQQDFKKYDLPDKFLELNLRSITRTDINVQRKKLEELEAKLREFMKLTASHLWLEDINNLEKQYVKQYGNE